jgi:hypothetical protein
MKNLIILLAVVVCAGCSSMSNGRTCSRPSMDPAALTAQNSAAPCYEYQLEVEPADVGTPFLHLVEATVQ